MQNWPNKDNKIFINTSRDGLVDFVEHCWNDMLLLNFVQIILKNLVKSKMRTLKIYFLKLKCANSYQFKFVQRGF